jgi:hypothetical protein
LPLRNRLSVQHPFDWIGQVDAGRLLLLIDRRILRECAL